MPFEIVFTDQARDHYRGLDARWKTTVKEALEIHLRHEPDKVSKSRIKRLRETLQPQFRLRVDEFRVFYDIDTNQRRVIVVAIVPKAGADEWLQQFGTRNP